MPYTAYQALYTILWQSVLLFHKKKSSDRPVYSAHADACELIPQVLSTIRVRRPCSLFNPRDLLQLYVVVNDPDSSQSRPIALHALNWSDVAWMLSHRLFQSNVSLSTAYVWLNEPLTFRSHSCSVRIIPFKEGTLWFGGRGRVVINTGFVWLTKNEMIPNNGCISCESHFSDQTHLCKSHHEHADDGVNAAKLHSFNP